MNEDIKNSNCEQVQQQVAPTSAADNPAQPRRKRYRIGTWIPAKKWEEVKKGFIEDGLTITELAVAHGLNRNTIYQKVCRDKWKIQRQDYLLKKDEHHQIRQEEATETGELKANAANKKRCIEMMIEITTTLLMKMETRTKMLASSDDKEIKMMADSMTNLYGILEDLLGISKGEGNTEKVGDGVVQADILKQALALVDEWKARALQEGNCDNCPLKDKKIEEETH